ncbi:hypothetical protein Taro_013959 [Colocasia esculenta]|uniref:CBS domain-containing protein CBSCBSPB1 n=1 Tax=Colocasia esculenta TaxID=4460 RepID=A0A843UHX7_COLES|nr:hypothetical protein [Colocasia esculenta]
MDSQGGAGGGGGGSSSRSGTPRKKKLAESGSYGSMRSYPHSLDSGLNGERTVKRLRLSKALTIPEATTVHEACHWMATHRVDAALLTDSNALLCGILTAKDIATRVIALELKPEETPVSKVMTRNPVFILSETLAVEALQKMVQGKFRHLPVVEKSEVIAVLEISKCLYDAIARMEKAAKKGKAIAAAVEGVEKQWGTSMPGHSIFIEILQEQMLRPPLSTIITENSKVVTVSPSDSVLSATRKMLEFRLSSAIITVDNKPCGILTSRDILMRVIVQNHPPELIPVEKVMTPNPECATIDTAIVDAMHTMHNGKFLHLPVVDRDGNIVSVIDVICITQAAVATVGSTGGIGNEATNSMMQKFWDSAMAMGPTDSNGDTVSEESTRLASDGTETGRSVSCPSSCLANTFSFKLEDKKGRKYRFNCETRSLTDLLTCILQRVGDDIDWKRLPQIMYEDEDQDKVVLASDSDLAVAVDHARLAGWKGLRLHLDFSGAGGGRNGGAPGSLDLVQRNAKAAAYGAVAAGAALVTGLAVMSFLKRSTS